MQLKCVIGSLRLNNGTEYSKGDIFPLDDEISVQTFLQSGYVKEVEPKQEMAQQRVQSESIKGKEKRKHKR